MIKRQSHAKPVVIEAVQLDPFPICYWRNDDCGIKRAVQQSGNLCGCGCLVQFQTHIGPCISEFPYRIG